MESQTDPMPLLSTKLFIPPFRPDLLSRPRLVDLLDSGLDHQLTLVSAPAGYGKTTLLSEWAQKASKKSQRAAVAWISLDTGDNDPARFWSYFAAALASVGAGQGDTRPSDIEATEPFLAGLINTAATIPERFVIVLDDYHHITNRQIHSAIDYLLGHLPPQMHIVVATRADPPLQMGRLRGQGRILELRQTDLRFTFDEMAAFLRRHSGLKFSDADLATLNSRTEGWAAGIQMAVLAVRGSSLQDSSTGARDVVLANLCGCDAPSATHCNTQAVELTDFVQAFSGNNRFVLDFLVEEVLNRRPQGTRDFLLQTSILDRLSAPLCNALTGQDDGQATLEQLEQANLFIVPLDHERRWYRYHGLFADFLRQRLGQAYPDRLKMLHERASEWYVGSGLAGPAIEHAKKAGDFERAADLIERAAEETWMRSEVATFLHWMAGIPQDILRARPILCVYHAVGLLMTARSLNEVEEKLKDAALGNAKSALTSEVAVVRSLITAFRGDARYCRELSRIGLASSSESPLLRSITAWSVGVSQFVIGDVDSAAQTFADAVRMGRESGNLMIAVVALCQLAEITMMRGQLSDAQETYEQALELAIDEQGRTLPIAGMALVGLGELSRERGDLKRSVRLLEQGVLLSREWGEIGALDGYIALARAQQALGNAPLAQEMISNAKRLAARFDATDADDRLVEIHQVRIWIAQGDLKAAERWARDRQLKIGVVEGDTSASCDQGVFQCIFRRYEWINWARLLMAKTRWADALSVLDAMAMLAVESGWLRDVIEIQVLRSIACHQLGYMTRAMAALEHALSLAEAEEYCRAFVDEGALIAPLLYQASQRGIKARYAGRLLEALNVGACDQGTAPTGGISAGSSEDAGLVEPLSDREIEVLTLVAEGLTNQEVAQRLFISLRTVKWHASNIYGKLAVRNRTQAVVRGRQLGLL